MNRVSTLIAVRDMEASKRFYYGVLGLEVIADFGANVMLTGGIALQSLETWKSFIGKQRHIVFEHNACELYFEEDDMDSFIEKLRHITGIAYLHPLLEHSWGQRAVRFYDPDRHIIEVGENMAMVVKRFLASGLSIQETAARMDVPVDYVRSCRT